MEMDIYTRRWTTTDTYHITRTQDGWDFDHKSFKGRCDRKGEPLLFASLNQDDVSYPRSLPQVMENLWNEADERGMSETEIQHELDKIAEWISQTEKGYPIVGDDARVD